MKNMFITLLILLATKVISAQEKDHPIISLGGTELLQTEELFDDYVIDLRIFKNLNYGFAIGGKVASDFYEISEAGVSARKMLVKKLYAYGDGGYSFSKHEGGFGEVGIGAYFLKTNFLAIHLGYKYYGGTSKSYMAAGFTMNFL